MWRRSFSFRPVLVTAVLWLAGCSGSNIEFDFDAGVKDAGVSLNDAGIADDDAGLFDAGDSESDASVVSDAGASCINGDGVFCGGDGVLGDINTLYQCTGGVATVSQVC